MLRMKNLLLVILITLTLKSFGTIHADFTVDKVSGCAPLLVNFTSTSTTTIGHISCRWEFDNGTGPSAANNPSVIYSNSGVYHVKLVVTNGSEKDSITKPITAFRLPQVDFDAPQLILCVDDTLHLSSNVSSGNVPITDYAWGFGNGLASSGPNTYYSYNSPGIYDVTLVVQDSNGCSKSLTKTQYVEVLAKPEAQFTISPGASCNATELISFTNTSVGTNLTYSWRLGGGVTSTATHPSQTYTQVIQPVWLTVTSPNGCVDSIMHKVSVTDVTADFVASRTTVCKGEMIHFSNNSNFEQSAFWTFGDGTTSTHNDPDKIYTTPGVYTVTLIEKIGQCADTITRTQYITVTAGFIASFTASDPPTDCSGASPIIFTNTTPSGSQFLWNFGDGTTSNQPNPSHSYNSNGNYTVTLTVTDTNGCTIPGTSLITIGSFKPSTSFSANRTGCPNVPIAFHNTTGAGASYFWTFGDGDTSNLQNPAHTYTNPGTYSVSLKVTSANGCDSTTIKSNYITIESIESDFTVNQKFSPCPPFVTLFTSTVNKPTVTYLWTFGDGGTDTAANPTHIYFFPGIYTVSMTVVTPNGCTDTVVYVDLIEVQGPSGTFTAAPTTGCAPLDVNFTANVSANTLTMWCDLGDGTLVTDSTAFHYIYTQLGTFKPKFLLVDHVGCTVPYDLEPVVTHAPPALNLQDTAVCVGMPVEISLETDEYQWTPATYLSCDTCSNVTITPLGSVAYIVTATNQYCQVTGALNIIADSLPVLTPSLVKVCKNSSIQLNAGNAFTMAWSPALYLDDSASLTPTSTPLDSVVYDVTGYNSLGCSVTTQVAVDVIDKLDISAVPDVTVCANDTFQLESTLEIALNADVNYAWSPANYFLDATAADATGAGLQTTATFQLIATSGTCIPDTASVNVHINALPDIQISESLTTTPYAETGLWANSTETLSYVWTAADSFSCASCKETNFYPGQTQKVYVTGTNTNGCSSSDSVEIRVVACDPESVFLPNIFTPNGDGQNDVLFMDSKAMTSISFFRVFDEWGRMVYETKNITDTWDGKVNGTPAAVNAFVYVLEGKCQNGGTVLKYGNITLVK